MRKEDIIRLHALLFQMRRYAELSYNKDGDVKLPRDYFGMYDSLKVTPVSLHRDKRAHQRAIFF